ncbi:MAG: alpha-1,4 glucan phosphorylase [Armatimonadota bacterium]|nr:MAG: alpha-1,4 glucan phosphorylase [Armatimonadota bacterium]
MRCDDLVQTFEGAGDVQKSLCWHIRYSLGKSGDDLCKHDAFTAVALTLRNRIVDLMIETERRYQQQDAKRLYYLSLEYLIGRSLTNNLINLGLYDLFREALLQQGIDLEELEEYESDAALGNGGLGRLAACFLDSLATLGMPAWGYGINYEYGIFKQEIHHGYQHEKPDKWLKGMSPWLIERYDERCFIPIYGRIEHTVDSNGHYQPRWVDWKLIVGVPYDMPIVGYGGKTVNVLRLFSARSYHEFDMQIFNSGDYISAVEQKIASETISKVLYPSDSVAAGKELRLTQEYFLVACALRDIVRRYTRHHDTFEQFPQKAAVQLNDTHPALAVVELMRILVDENHLPWEHAWQITEQTFGYTNHTLMPEALEKWPVELMERLLPRHLQIIYEINRRFLEHVMWLYPGDVEKVRRVSLIEEGEHKQVRMAHLAIVGSHSVNGVSELHSQLIKTSLVPDFYELFPHKFNNKTNGVTPRRWLKQANPRLSLLIDSTIGEKWVTDLSQLRKLEPYAQDESFQQQFRHVKDLNKLRLAHVIRETTGLSVPPESLFDVQVKRIHEYKRQLLNVLHIIYEYLRLTEDRVYPTVPRTVIFAGKAAPGYWAAKQIIKLINNVASVINHDHRARDYLHVVFLPDYRVSLAEVIIPAADLSEQISTAGMEASGTSCMKFAMNGALTIGTLDGANIEIRKEVGEDNIYIFGHTAEQLREMRREGSYDPRVLYESNPTVKRVMDTFLTNMFCPHEPGLFRWIFDSLVHHGDYYFHLADLPSYIETHERAAQEYRQPKVWTRKAILNVARIGKFSSDRTVQEYARDIWNIQPVKRK